MLDAPMIPTSSAAPPSRPPPRWRNRRRSRTLRRARRRTSSVVANSRRNVTVAATRFIHVTAGVAGGTGRPPYDDADDGDHDDIDESQPDVRIARPLSEIMRSASRTSGDVPSSSSCQHPERQCPSTRDLPPAGFGEQRRDDEAAAESDTDTVRERPPRRRCSTSAGSTRPSSRSTAPIATSPARTEPVHERGDDDARAEGSTAA